MSVIKSISYIFVLAFCLFVPLSKQQAYDFPQEVEFPQEVIKVMASREKRYHHFLWHNIRDSWNIFDSDTQKELADLGWEPPRPSRGYDELGRSTTLFDNDSGEDFLYMHREMMRQVNEIIDLVNPLYGHITGWKSVPSPDDPDWPVPPNYFDDDLSLFIIKSDEFYYGNIQPMEEALKDPNVLRTLSLGEFGTYIETTIHNWMHTRFSNTSDVGYRSIVRGAMPYIDKIWDDPKYDWLADTYSSHVNPIFWKLHGWVDDRIEDWRIANNQSSIKWKGTWTGGPMSSLSDLLMKTKKSPHNDPEAVSDVLEKVFNIVAKFGRESSFFDPVQSDFETRFNINPK